MTPFSSRCALFACRCPQLRGSPGRSPIPAVLIPLMVMAASLAASAAPMPIRPVEGQPLTANVQRVIGALDYHGAPLPTELTQAAAARDGENLQQLLDPRVLLVVQISPEMRGKVARGSAPARLQQAGYTPVLFDMQPAVEVRLNVRDADGTPPTGRFLFTDRQGHVFPPQIKWLAPGLFFQKHIYRADGETVLLPPGGPQPS